MIVLSSNQPTFMDVDDTLIKWSPTFEEECEFGVPFAFDYGDGKGIIKGIVVPHRVHVQQLKKHALRGHTVFLWSAGGELWCSAVAKALGLEEYVSYCMAKPTWAYDDKQANDFIKTQYMEDE